MQYFTAVSVCPLGDSPGEEEGEMEEGSDGESELEEED